jgi:epoxyqueuosine reductase QueG
MESELSERILSLARTLGIADVGFADADAWDTDELVSKAVPECGRPSALMRNARSVIVLGIPVQRAIIATSPSTYYAEHYRTVNSMLDHAAQRIVMELRILGYPSIYVPRDGYRGIEGLRKDPSSFFSHRHSAYLAGMGTFGINSMIITKKNGPRIRFVSVITTAELPYGKPSEDHDCGWCMRCKDECPAKAAGYPEEMTDVQRCVEYSAKLKEKGISPCGRCIFVCPMGDDAKDPLPTDGAIANIRRYAE